MNASFFPRRRSVIHAGVAAAVTGGLAACAGSGSPASPSSTDDDVAAKTGNSADGDDAARHTGGTHPDTVVATAVVNALQVFAEPANMDELGEPQDAEQELNRAERVTGQVVLLALEVGAVWTQVQLPVRPNGSVGWVRSSEVSLSSHNFQIDIDLEEHEIVMTKAGVDVARSPVGVGRADRPTPGGDYFITELLQPPEPDGLYGPYAYGLSGYSDVLMDFRGGTGVIGVHGTNEPDLVGSDVSSGCIRMPNDEITRWVDTIGVPLGTPVTIRA